MSQVPERGLTLPQRAIYLDLLGFCYVEGGITADKRVLISRLGIGPEHEADLDAALKEFEPDGDGRLNHPRVLIEAERLEAARNRRSNGGKARAANVVKAKPPYGPQTEVNDPEDDCGF
jgi:Protein of unknown function (DUF1376)